MEGQGKKCLMGWVRLVNWLIHRGRTQHSVFRSIVVDWNSIAWIGSQSLLTAVEKCLHLEHNLHLRDCRRGWIPWSHFSKCFVSTTIRPMLACWHYESVHLRKKLYPLSYLILRKQTNKRFANSIVLSIRLQTQEVRGPEKEGPWPYSGVLWRKPVLSEIFLESWSE
jgi:hypothetical protein